MIKILKKENDYTIKVLAVDVLALIGNAAKDAAPTLIYILKNEKTESELLFASSRALVSINPDPQEIIPVAFDLLQNGTKLQRIQAANLLEKMGDEAFDEIKTIIYKILDKDEQLAKQLVREIYTSIREVESLERSINEARIQLVNQFQRRNDLTLNLIEIVKTYLPQEKHLYNQIDKAHSKLINTKNFTEQIEAYNDMTTALISLNSIYPKLKNDKNFYSLYKELDGIENMIAVERKRYNNAVKNYNAKIRNIPFPELFNFETAVIFKTK